MTHGAAHLEMGNTQNRLIFRGIRKTINRRCAVRCYTCSCQTSFYAPAGHIRHCRCAQKCDTCSRRYEGITAFSISYTDHPFPGVQEEPLAASSLNAFVRIIPHYRKSGAAQKKQGLVWDSCRDGMRKTVAARGLANGRGPPSGGRDSVFRCHPDNMILSNKKESDSNALWLLGHPPLNYFSNLIRS